ncbi:hypothetical protein BFJ71_g16937 [Fusarium oxysporum]|nr:hypothetical protein BFJ71_g16937 [Fusarium oxysporum]
MACSAMSDDFVRRAMLNGNQKIELDPADIFYRPAYSLPNWEMVVNHWSDDKVKPYSFKIDFSGLADVTWESMGHKKLDNVHVPKLNKVQRELLKKLKGKVIFYGKPQVLDVERGLWDVKQLLQAGKLSKFAPDSVKHKFCKTTRMLLCWGYDIELTLPESIGSKSIEDINLSFLRVPVAEISDNGRVLKFTTEQTNYPWLVAVLATVV